MISYCRFVALFAAFGLSACVAGTPPASRGAITSQIDLQQTASAAQTARPGADKATAQTAAHYQVAAITVTVPRALKVSEANTIKPRADIVWRGEGFGDRHAQVQTIFVEAMQQGTAAMTKGRAVNLEIVVARFHALTEKTRYTIGGMHEMTFTMTLRDAATGEVLDGPRAIVADIRASGGAQALAEDQAGRTQRVVTVERLAQVIRREMSVQAPGPQIISRGLAKPVQITQ
jgi:hypothetical protein